jgi:hypothetical protein
MPSGSRANNVQNQAYQAARAYRDGLSQERDASSKGSDALQQGQGQLGPKEELARNFEEKRAAFLKASADLRPSYDRAMAEYRAFQADPAVKEDLNAVRQATKSAAILGPSKEFQRAIDTVREAERAFSPETAATKAKARRKTSRP